MHNLLILAVFFVNTIPGFCQNIHKDSIRVDFIEFGSGGGFSGASKNYVLTRTGELYLIKNMLTDAGSLEQFKKIKNAEVNKIFHYVKKKRLTEFTYNEPGNLFHYITLAINNKNNHMAWGNANSTAPKPLLILSTRLYNLL